MTDPVFHHFEDHVYDWGRFQKMARTPIPKLPSTYHPELVNHFMILYIL